ncbi:hypothetical protein AB1N83_013884 [Pleurotus pulmonarius]
MVRTEVSLRSSYWVLHVTTVPCYPCRCVEVGYLSASLLPTAGGCQWRRDCVGKWKTTRRGGDEKCDGSIREQARRGTELDALFPS